MNSNNFFKLLAEKVKTYGSIVDTQERQKFFPRLDKIIRMGMRVLKNVHPTLNGTTLSHNANPAPHPSGDSLAAGCPHSGFPCCPNILLRVYLWVP